MPTVRLCMTGLLLFALGANAHWSPFPPILRRRRASELAPLFGPEVPEFPDVPDSYRVILHRGFTLEQHSRAIDFDLSTVVTVHDPFDDYPGPVQEPVVYSYQLDAQLLDRIRRDPQVYCVKNDQFSYLIYGQTAAEEEEEEEAAAAAAREEL